MGMARKLAQPINVHAAKTHFSKLLARVERGEEVIIARGGKPVAKLTPIAPPPVKRAPPGFMKDVIISGDIDEPLPDDILDAFYNGPIFPDEKSEP